MSSIATRKLKPDVRHFPHFDERRVNHDRDRKGLTIGQLAKLAGVSEWSTGRAVHGHPITRTTMQKIAEALAAAPVVDGGLLAEPGQLEEAG